MPETTVKKSRGRKIFFPPLFFALFLIETEAEKNEKKEPGRKQRDSKNLFVSTPDRKNFY